MRILSAVTRNYYGHANSIEPMFIAFTEPLERLGHTVETFDHANLLAELGPVACGERFLRTVRKGGYDLVLYQTGGRDHMVREAIGEAARFAPVVAWNSDDDWQWDTYCRHLAPYFTFMVTTYPHVYEANSLHYPNLRLSQWACFERFADFNRPKDLNFTFAGQIYRTRVPEMRRLRREAGLKVHGLGSLRVWCPPFNNRRFRELAAKILPATNRALELDEVHAIWNRSKISYTPLGASVNPSMLQIKGRVFEMGMSGTLMLCNHSPYVSRYYDPGTEYIPFYDLEDCADKARFYLRHDTDRQRIAQAYYRRTKAEHLWEHRWQQIFRDIGVGTARSKVA